ncbi:unnamed protein product [Durusdinium trenchii]|uniref:Uncharacterized protein n=1 Tax=Durusdinium trenchii TaxID=1381693 RepID=A0ABP0IN13_9DINO
MTWIIQAAVLFALPATVMRYIVEFAIGPPSTIYRRETCRPFDIYDHLRKTQASEDLQMSPFLFWGHWSWGRQHEKGCERLRLWGE